MKKADALVLSSLRSDVRDGLVRDIRIHAGLTQAEVAQSVGASRAAVYHWEAGLRMPRGEVALRYGRLLMALKKSRADREQTRMAGEV